MRIYRTFPETDEEYVTASHETSQSWRKCSANGQATLPTQSCWPRVRDLPKIYSCYLENHFNCSPRQSVHLVKKVYIVKVFFLSKCSSRQSVHLVKVLFLSKCSSRQCLSRQSVHKISFYNFALLSTNNRLSLTWIKWHVVMFYLIFTYLRWTKLIQSVPERALDFVSKIPIHNFNNSLIEQTYFRYFVIHRTRKWFLAFECV